MSIIDKLGITESELEKLWSVWAGEWHHSNAEFEAVWRGYTKLSLRTGLSIKQLKKIMKVFRDKKIAYHSPCINGDYIPSGSGNFLYDQYENMSFEEIKDILNAQEPLDIEMRIEDG